MRRWSPSSRAYDSRIRAGEVKLRMASETVLKNFSLKCLLIIQPGTVSQDSNENLQAWLARRLYKLCNRIASERRQ